MPADLGHRLTYANVMSTIAVFVALGGSSYAAVRLSNNSVKSKHIAPGQVKRADLARGAVTSDKVLNGTIALKDFDAQTASDLKGAKGDPGPAGPSVTGPKGEPGATNVVVRSSSSSSINGATPSVDCAPGERATGGSAEYGDVTNPTGSAPSRPKPHDIGTAPTGWRARNQSGGNAMMVVWVVCASP